MPKRPRRNYTPVFKSKIALAAIKGDKTVAELARQFDVHVNQVTQWKSQLLDRAGIVFEGSGTGLALTQGSVVASLDYHGCAFLRRSTGESYSIS